MHLRPTYRLLILLILWLPTRLAAQDSLQLRFMKVIEQDDLKAVKECVRKGADVNMTVVASSPNYLFFISRRLYLEGMAKSRAGEIVYVGPIHANADRANIKILQYLRKKKTNIEAGDSDGKTALMYALRNPGGEEYALYLLKKGANYFSVDAAGNTVMHYAAYGGNIEGIRMTYGGGVGVNLRNHEGITPFHAAAVFSKVEVLQELQNLGADVHAQDSAGLNALHYAAAYGDPSRLEWLLKQAPELNVESKEGYTPLDIARAAKNAEAVTFLKSRGGKYARYRYAEMLDALQKKDYQQLRTILEDGADPNRKSPEYPLLIAVESGDATAADLLLKAGAHADLHNAQGQSLLEMAITKGMPTVAAVLLAAKASAENRLLPMCMSQIAKLETPGNWVDVIAALALQVRDLNVAGGDLNVPALHYAAYLGQEEIVNSLLRAGADANAIDSDGWTALHWTVMKRDLLRLHLEKLRIAEALIAKGATINPLATTAKVLPHTEMYLAKRIPVHATPFDVLTYALPKDADLSDLLTAKGGASGLAAVDYHNNGVYLFEHKAIQAAQLDFNRAVIADPRMAEAYYDRARCSSMNNAYVEVERDLAKAIALQPVFPEAFLARGQARIELQKYKEAEADINMALHQGASKGVGLYWRGKCRLRLDDREGACSDFAESGASGYSDGAQAVKLYCRQ
jgi:uncharacterized protein